MKSNVNSQEIVRLYSELRKANAAGTDNLVERTQLAEKVNTELKGSGVGRFDLILMCEVEPNPENLLEMERRSRVTSALTELGIEVREKQLVLIDEDK